MHRKLALVGVSTLLGAFVLAGQVSATNHCQAAISPTSLTAGSGVTVTGTGFTGHTAVTVAGPAAIAEVSQVVGADGSLGPLTVGPFAVAGTYTVTVTDHGDMTCGPFSATVTVAAAAAAPTPAAGTPAPTQAGTGTLPDAALSAPGQPSGATALGLVLLSSATALCAMLWWRQRAR